MPWAVKFKFRLFDFAVQFVKQAEEVTEEETSNVIPGAYVSGDEEEEAEEEGGGIGFGERLG